MANVILDSSSLFTSSYNYIATGNGTITLASSSIYHIGYHWEPMDVETTVFTDDFNRFNSAFPGVDWIELVEPVGSDWRIASNRLQYRVNPGSNTLGVLQYATTIPGQDYRVSTVIRFNSSNNLASTIDCQADLLTKYDVGLDRFYRTRVDLISQRIILGIKTGVSVVVVSTIFHPFVVDTDYLIEVLQIGNNIKVYVDSVLKIDYTDLAVVVPEGTNFGYRGRVDDTLSALTAADGPLFDNFIFTAFDNGDELGAFIGGATLYEIPHDYESVVNLTLVEAEDQPTSATYHFIPDVYNPLPQFTGAFIEAFPAADIIEGFHVVETDGGIILGPQGASLYFDFPPVETDGGIEIGGDLGFFLIYTPLVNGNIFVDGSTEYDYSIFGNGEIIVNGSAEYDQVLFGNGEIIVNGSGSFSFDFSYIATGNIEIGGTHVSVTTYEGDGLVHVHTGVGENTIVSVGYNYTTSGSIYIPSADETYTTSGGIIVDGIASIEYQYDTDGGIVVNGDIGFFLIAYPTGGITVNGSAFTNISYTTTGEIIIVDGSAEAGQPDYGYNPTGEIVVNGTSTIVAVYHYIYTTDGLEIILSGVVRPDVIKRIRRPYLKYFDPFSESQSIKDGFYFNRPSTVQPISSFRIYHQPAACIIPAELKGTHKKIPECYRHDGKVRIQGAWIPQTVIQQQGPFVPDRLKRTITSTSNSQFVKVS